MISANPLFFDTFEEIDFLGIFDYTYTMLSGMYYNKAIGKVAGGPDISRYLDLLQVFDDFSSQTYLRKSYVESKLAQYLATHIYQQEPKKVVRRFSE